MYTVSTMCTYSGYTVYFQLIQCVEWIECIPTVNAMYTYSEYNVCLQWIQCVPTVNTMYTCSKYNACLQWIQCTPTVSTMYTYSGYNVYLQWIQCVPPVDTIYTYSEYSWCLLVSKARERGTWQKGYLAQKLEVLTTLICLRNWQQIDLMGMQAMSEGKDLSGQHMAKFLNARKCHLINDVKPLKQITLTLSSERKMKVITICCIMSTVVWLSLVFTSRPLMSKNIFNNQALVQWATCFKVKCFPQK